MSASDRLYALKASCVEESGAASARLTLRRSKRCVALLTTNFSIKSKQTIEGHTLHEQLPPTTIASQKFRTIIFELELITDNCRIMLDTYLIVSCNYTRVLYKDIIIGLQQLCMVWRVRDSGSTVCFERAVVLYFE